MKELLLSASALFALTAVTVGSASAADLRAPVYRRAAPVVVAPSNWTGFYVGFNLGESKDVTSTTETWTWFHNYPPGTLADIDGSAGAERISGPLSAATQHQDRRASVGFLGGLQWGYNWQIGGLLLGLEGDWNWSNEKDTLNYVSQTPQTFAFGAAPAINNTSQGWTSEERIKWLSTWRARLGWAHDCFLWYVTAGVAWAKIENNYILASTPGRDGFLGNFFPGLGDSFNFNGGVWGLPGGVAAANFSTTKTGWVVGGGVETSIGELLGWGHNWSMKLEYLYVDLGEVTNTIGTGLVPLSVLTDTPLKVTCCATGSTSFFSSSRVREQIVRVGLNYRFSYAAV